LTTQPDNTEQRIDDRHQRDLAGPSQRLGNRQVGLDNRPFGFGYVACVAQPLASILGRVISVHTLCLDVCTEITQFILGWTLKEDYSSQVKKSSDSTSTPTQKNSTEKLLPNEIRIPPSKNMTNVNIVEKLVTARYAVWSNTNFR
jgi:hypothetical protein